MKTQRKLLTEEKMKEICTKNTELLSYGIYCKDACPLKVKIDGQYYCFKDMERLEQAIRDYWNEEVEVIE